jgi:hypothetical protein
MQAKHAAAVCILNLHLMQAKHATAVCVLGYQKLTRALQTSNMQPRGQQLLFGGICEACHLQGRHGISECRFTILVQLYTLVHISKCSMKPTEAISCSRCAASRYKAAGALCAAWPAEQRWSASNVDKDQTQTYSSRTICGISRCWRHDGHTA